MNPWKISTLAFAVALGLLVGRVTRPAQAGIQPHMRNALSWPRGARTELDKATPDKGGHRVKALELTAAAIEQVEKGIQFDDHH